MKVHHIDGVLAVTTTCGKSVVDLLKSLYWPKVTCQSCLKARPS